MTREQLVERKRALEAQREHDVAQVNFTLGALALINELLQEMDNAEAKVEAGEKDKEHA